MIKQKIKSILVIGIICLGWSSCFVYFVAAEQSSAKEVNDIYKFGSGDMSVEIAKDKAGLYNVPFVIKYKGKEIKIGGFDIRYGVDKGRDMDISGKELSEYNLSSEYKEIAKGLEIVQKLGDEANKIVYKIEVEQDKKGIGLRVNIKSSPGMLTKINSLGHNAKVKRLYWGNGVVVDELKGGYKEIDPNYSTSLALEFENGIYEFQNIDSYVLALAIDPSKNLYSFKINREEYFDKATGDFKSVGGHCRWDQAVNEVTYTYYWTDNFMSGIVNLRNTINAPKSNTVERLKGVQTMDWRWLGSVNIECFEAVRLWQSLFIRGITDMFVHSTSGNSSYLTELCYKYGALKGIYQNYYSLKNFTDEGVEKYIMNWSNADIGWLTREQVMYCPKPELHDNKGHLMIQDWGVGKDYGFSMNYPIAIHSLPDLIYKHAPIVKKAQNINAIYQDVISGQVCGYFDNEGKYISKKETLESTRKFFQENSKYYGPVVTEFEIDDYIGYADSSLNAHMFSASALGIENAGDWEFVPFKDLLHHDRFVIYISNRTYKFGWGQKKIYDSGLTARDWAYGEIGRDLRSTTILMGQPMIMETSSQIGLMTWDWSDPELFIWYIKDYYMHHQFHENIGLKIMTNFEFAEGNIHRQKVEYENGTKVCVNRGKEDWEVEGYILPQYGFLIKGNGILEYSVIRDKDNREWIEYVDTAEEIYADPRGKEYDFGKVKTDVHVAIQNFGKGVIKVVPYPVDSKGEIEIRTEKIQNGWDNKNTKIKGYNGVGNLIGEAKFERVKDGVRFKADAVKQSVFYVIYQEGVDLKKASWDIGTDLKPIEDWKYEDNNLVQSPGFEEEWYGLHGWDGFPDPNAVTSSIDKNVYHKGRCSLKLEFSGKGTSRYKQKWQMIKVEKGEKYKLSYFVKTDNLSEKIGLYVGASHIFIYQPYYMRDEIRKSKEYYVKGTNDWEYVETTFTVDEENMDKFGRILIGIHMPEKDAEGKAWFDDVRVEKL